MSVSMGPVWGWQQKLKFVCGYAADKLTVFLRVSRPRWAFWFYELRYSLSNALHTIVGGQGRALWNRSELVETPSGTFRVRKQSQDASLISPAFERQDMDQLLYRLREELKKGPVCFLDIGANLGRYTITVAKTLPEVQIWAFEPDPENFRILQDNYQLNELHLPQVQLFSVALGEASEQRDLYGHKARGGDNSLVPQKGFVKVASVNVKPLQMWLDRLPNEIALFVKLDVEGFEIPVLRGAGDLGGRFRLVEILIEDVQGRSELYSTLHQMNFQAVTKLTPYNSWWRLQ